MTKARIIATVGPASQSPEILAELLLQGVDVFRLNFSHGNHEWHGLMIDEIRNQSRQIGRPVAILQDLQGIKIRTGSVEPDPVVLLTGQSLQLTTESVLGDAEQVSISYPDLPNDVSAGDEILLSDGQIQLRVVATTRTSIECSVLSGGRLVSNQGVNVPGVSVSAPPLTEKDRADLLFGIRKDVDYIALSFVQNANDVSELRAFLDQVDADIPIIAKLEKPSSIENLEGILERADGVMVARGDLGVEMSPEKVPMIQKRVIAEANRCGKLVITATQMLESMIRSPRPTRAEASDVANAVLDGTDAVMLSGETATGKYPVDAVRMMSKIVAQAETYDVVSPYFEQVDDLSFPQTICISAYHASRAIAAKGIVAFTQSGSTARMISKYRPPVQIWGITPHTRIARRLMLYPGVQTVLMREIGNVDELITELEDVLIERGLVEPGDKLVILTGAPILERGNTNLMKLHTVRAREKETE